MSLKAILESHPIKNLNAVIKSVKSDIAPKLALSKDRKRHSKAKLIEHILALDKMGLLKERPGMYEKPVRAKKVKAAPKVEIIVDVEKAKKGLAKIDMKKAKKAGVKFINEPKKAEPKTEPKVEDKARKTRSDKGGKHSGQKYKVLPSGRKVKHKDGKTEAQLSIELGLKKEESKKAKAAPVDTKKILKEAVTELSDNFESQVEDKGNDLELDEHKFFAQQKPTILVIEENKNLTKEQKTKLETKAYASFIKEYTKLNKKKKKAAPQAKQNEGLLTLIDKFNKKYNAVEIKKQNLNKSNLKDFTNPYFKQLEIIEKELDNVDDPIEFFKTNKKISGGFVDIKKNFVRRVKARTKAVAKKK